jgi:short-subunit dehydrogenase
LHVALVARRLPLLEDLGGQLATTYGTQYRAVGADLAEPDFLATVEAATRDLDIGLVISNAGGFLPGAFLQLDRSRLLRMVHLNALAHLDVSHYFGQRLAARGRGGLLLVASTAGLQGVPFSAEYAAAKGFVLNLGEALHVELQKAGVHVTTLLPGAIDTPYADRFWLRPHQHAHQANGARTVCGRGAGRAQDESSHTHRRTDKPHHGGANPASRGNQDVWKHGRQRPGKAERPAGTGERPA